MAARLLRVFVLFGSVGVLWASGLMGFQTSRYAVCSEPAVWEHVKAGVRGQLVAPKQAVFPELDAVRIERQGACAFRVAGYVDASNLLGVLLRADFRATVAQDDQGALRMQLQGLETRGSLSAPQALAVSGQRG